MPLPTKSAKLEKLPSSRTTNGEQARLAQRASPKCSKSNVINAFEFKNLPSLVGAGDFETQTFNDHADISNLLRAESPHLAVPPSWHECAAVDVEDRAGNEAGFGRGQESDGVGYILRRRQTPQRRFSD